MQCMHAAIHPSIQPASQPLMQYAVQFNAMQVSSISFDLLRFDVFKSIQCKFCVISFHFMSCHFIQSSACIQPQLPIEPAFYTALSRLSGPPRTSHAFPDASWALPQAPAKDGWSTDQTSPTDLCNKKASERSCWTSVLDSLGLFLTRFVNVCK